MTEKQAIINLERLEVKEGRDPQGKDSFAAPTPKSVKEKRETRGRRHSRSVEASKKKEERSRSRSANRRESRMKYGLTTRVTDDSDEDHMSSREREEEDADGIVVETARENAPASSPLPPSASAEGGFDAAITRAVLKETQKELNDYLGEDSPSIEMDWKGDGHGRKPGTGDCYMRRLRDTAKALIEEARRLKELRDGIAPNSLSNNRRAMEKKFEEEMRNAPTATLPALILEAVNSVDYVAQRSGRLKGEYVGGLNQSAATIKVALSQLITRGENAGDRYEKEAELDRLRQKITEQKEEIKTLRELQRQHDQMRRELQTQKEQMDRLQALLPHQSSEVRGAKRKKINYFPSSDEEMGLPERENFTDIGGAKEGTCHPETGAMEKDEEEANKREEIMEEIRKQGMPAAVRPTLQGRQRVLDPEVPPVHISPGREDAPSGGADEPSVGRKREITGATMENRLARMMVTCMDERIKRLEETLRQELLGRVLQTSGGKKEGEGIREKSITTPNSKGVQAEPAGKTRDIPKEKKIGRKGGKQPEEGKRNPPEKKEKGGRQGLAAREQTAVAPSPTQMGSSQTAPEDQWSKVVGRKEKAARGRQGRQQQAGKSNASAPPPPPVQRQQQQQTKKRKEPRTSAVTLTCPRDNYAECMGLVRGSIKLKDLGIEKPPNLRRTATGAISLELSGQGSAEKADALAAKMAEVLTGKEGVKVGRPTMTAEMRIVGFDESVSAEEIRGVIAEAGKSLLSEVTVGPIRNGARGLYTTVVRCPLRAANLLAKEGKVVLGWTRAKIEMLAKRPLQCYRCQEVGHTRATCRSEVDRTGACYRCGEVGHAARECGSQAHCAVCDSKGLLSNHRVGGKACSGCRKVNGGKMTSQRAKSKPKVASQITVTGAKRDGNKLLLPKGQAQTAERMEVDIDENGKNTDKYEKGRVDPAAQQSAMEVESDASETPKKKAGTEAPEGIN